MKLSVLLLSALFTASLSPAQNLGIGTSSPFEKLDVPGKVKADSLIVSLGGSAYDFLMRTGTGSVNFRKGHGAVGLSYIIAIDGIFPSQQGGYNYDLTIIGETKLFAGPYAPSGWMFCEGQLLDIGDYPNLYAILGNQYGGDGESNFALPDLRATVPVGKGSSVGGYSWAIGQKSN